MSDPTPLSDLPKPRDAEAVEKTREGFERSRKQLEEAEAQTGPLTQAAKDAEEELHAARVLRIRDEASEQDVLDAKEAAAEAREAFEENLVEKKAIQEARDTLKEDLDDALAAAGVELYEEWEAEGHRRSQALVNAAHAFREALEGVDKLRTAAKAEGIRRRSPTSLPGMGGSMVPAGRWRKEATTCAARIVNAAAEHDFLEDPS